MSENKIWQSFGELNEPENFQKQHEDEFREELPFEGFDDKGLADAKAPRRDFLKYLGFSTAAATLAASCKIPVRHAIPYANKPENLVPGVAKYYATTYVQDGDVVPIVAKVRDGRPIKIEGNDQSKIAKGGTSARVQASVLDLYDTNRLRFPQQKTKEASLPDGQGKFDEVPTFEQFDKMVQDAMKAATGTVVLLSSTIVSPTTKKIIAEFPGLRHVQYDPVSYSGMLLANEASGFGRKIPSYHFEAAKVIVSLDADFLGTWLSPVEFARGYAKGRKIDEKDPKMSKHYQFESRLSPTGANADERFTHRPSQTAAVANALLSAVLGTASVPDITDAKLKKGIEKVAADLNANNGAALVVSGSNDMNVQVIVNAINSKIGAYGKTIDWSAPVNYRQGIDKDMFDLVEDMNAGKIGTLLIYSSNPAYTYHDAEKFKAGLKKVSLTVSFSGRMDETTELCNHSIPDHHFLESWGEAEAKAGYTSFLQPTIFPLFKTRHFQTSLMRWSGNNANYEDYFRDYWTAKLGSTEAFDKVLQDGIIEPADDTMSGGSYNDGAVAAAVAAVGMGSLAAATGNELIVYEKISIGSGAQSANPWLQELPDPISKATWDNYAMISIPKAKELGVKVDRDYEYYPEKPVISIKAGKFEIELPVLVIPGMNADTIAVALGYGRSAGMGKTAAGVGKNAYVFSSFNGTTVNYLTTGVTATNLNKKYKVAQTQRHNSYEGRIEVVRETTLATYKKEPGVIPEYREEMAKDFARSTGDFRREATLYPQHDQPGIKWGMTIDMNSCIACSACIVACHAENNVPVVGKREVLRYHDMHWLRIDRYFISDSETPDDLKGVVFQPMLCQHCDNAPCENVCPVAATNHSSEGINQMAYNRCIGTRYCAQNCPFKVRRFNWADYTGADSFPNNQDQKIIGRLDDVVHQMNEDLSRMVLNPDVTVRSRGVMEKCTFCVQKLQAAKLDAKKENRVLNDGDAKTACQTACPTEAIVFGNSHDKDSQVTRMRADNPNRSFYVLDQLHVLPNITYFEKVRNTEEIIETEKHEEMEAGTQDEKITDSISVPSAMHAIDTTH
ncbi:MAG TPA: TAT-variant-translocated molybdopterin oxidoreductase [Chitinophagaceae bacterium]|nr:TAT-variant-translocated molybdopterin oxidoreductase [Chitinophagaceae bacterium]